MGDKFLDKRRNRLIVILIGLIGVLLGIGAFIGVMLIRKQHQQQKQEQQKNAQIQQNTTKVISSSSANDDTSDEGMTLSSTSEPSPASISTVKPTKIRESDAPSESPLTTISPTGVAEKQVEVTTFYAIGDVPYTVEQALELKTVMLNIPSDAEFVIHVGDIFFKRGKTCLEQDYIDVAETLKTSPVPVFIVLGDNEYNDCPNFDQGLQWWQEQFSQFTERFWPDNKFNITYQPNRRDNFAFTNKGTLFIGLDIVGGRPRNRTDWDNRLSDEADWTIQLMKEWITQSIPSTPRIVIFGHANPKRIHHLYFETIAAFIENYLNNGVPILYLCGDRHRWLYESNFYDQPSWTRIILTGKTDDPPLKVMIDNDGTYTPYAFQFDRMLPPGHHGLNGTIVLNDDEYSGTDDLFADIAVDVYKNEDAVNSTQLFKEMQERLAGTAGTWPTPTYVTANGQVLSVGTNGGTNSTATTTGTNSTD